ncbi:MAG: hypothetical protein KDB73_18285 [Planctomycetes bacterium]|nr:hypothetical protein [Planctomycetota bacterium]
MWIVGVVSGWLGVGLGLAVVVASLWFWSHPEQAWRLERAHLRRFRGIEGATPGPGWRRSQAISFGVGLFFGALMIVSGIQTLSRPEVPAYGASPEAPPQSYPTPDGDAGRRLHERATR